MLGGGGFYEPYLVFECGMECVCDFMGVWFFASARFL